MKSTQYSAPSYEDELEEKKQSYLSELRDLTSKIKGGSLKDIDKKRIFKLIAVNVINEIQ